MRRGSLLVSVLITLLAGCQADRKPAPTTQPTQTVERYYEPVPASALAFAVPIAQLDAPLDLSRDIREPAAFVGYDELIRSYIYVRTDDRWTADGNDRYERRAIIERLGASSR